MLIYDYYFFDIIHGTDTKIPIVLSHLNIKSENLDKAKRYNATQKATFYDSIKSLDPDVFDGTFIDFGSGKGRVLIMAAKIEFKRIVGVEFSKELCDIACLNLNKTKLQNVEVIHMDASEYIIPDNASVFFFFNPFDEEVFSKVLSNINKSISKNPRKAYFIYVHPVLEKLFSYDKYELIKKIFSPLGQNVSVYRSTLFMK